MHFFCLVWNFVRKFCLVCTFNLRRVMCMWLKCGFSLWKSLLLMQFWLFLYFYDIADKCNHIYCCHKLMSVSVLSIFFSWFYSRPVLASCLCSRLCVLCFIISSRNRTLASFIFSSRNRTLACYIFFTQTKGTIVAKKWWS